MKEVKIYPSEYVWVCPYCCCGNYSEDGDVGIMRCVDCGEKAKVKE